MRAELIPSYEYQRQRWKNELGWTREILCVGADRNDYDWRLSIAEIDQDCPFSAFPGYQRSLVLLQGNGMQLKFDDGESGEVLPPHGRVDFDGARTLHCHLLDGPTQDFNLIWNPRRVSAQLHHRPLVGSMVFFAEPDSEWLIYVVAGWAAVKDQVGPTRATAGDSLRLRPQDGYERRLILEGAGEIFSVRIARASPP